jgi:hypothetical protein
VFRPAPSLPRAPRPGRRGAVPGWLPLTILVGALFVIVRSLESDARARGVARVDVKRYALHESTRYVHPAWRSALERVLRRQSEIAVDDSDAIDDLVADLRALSFIAEVGEPEVIWPDGLSVPLRLHEPVACIRVGGRDFLPVSADGSVLSGYTLEPHAAYGAWLPALGPHGLGEAERGEYEPGDTLQEAALLDALDIARSLWFHLSPDEVRALGPLVIDASRERAPTASALPGGVVLNLEGARRILFGRAPKPSAPGELPVARKWQHVRTGLEILRDDHPQHRLWDVLDVRFDELTATTRAEWAARELEAAKTKGKGGVEAPR